MNQNDSLTPLQKRQWRIWKEGKNRGMNDTEIAKLMSRSRPTVTRLKRKAKQTGAYQEWIDETVPWAQEEFRQLHLLIKAKNPNLAYSTIGRIIEKSLVSYVKSKTEVEGELRHIIVKMWKPENGSTNSTD
jgi:transposase